MGGWEKWVGRRVRAVLWVGLGWSREPDSNSGLVRVTAPDTPPPPAGWIRHIGLGGPLSAPSAPALHTPPRPRPRLHDSVKVSALGKRWDGIFHYFPTAAKIINNMHVILPLARVNIIYLFSNYNIFLISL